MGNSFAAKGSAALSMRHVSASEEPGALVFPPATYTEAGHSQQYCSRWQRSGNDAYDAITVRMQQVTQ
jgi:hypothetical protein